jgi:hypothetical protein
VIRDLDITVHWWAVITAAWPEQAGSAEEATRRRDLIDYLEDTGLRDNTLAVLQADMEQLPPWAEVRSASAAHGAAMLEQYDKAELWLAALEDEAATLSRLSDREYCARMIRRAELAARLEDAPEQPAETA